MKGRYAKIQRIYAILFMMVMMLQMGVKNLHQHDHTCRSEFACEECENHQSLHQHLMTWDGENDDCALCQLLTSPFTPVSVDQETIYNPQYQPLQSCLIACYIASDRSSFSLRGPPTLRYL